MKCYLGEVRKIENNGKPRVRFYGRNDDENETPDDNLTLCTVGMPSTSASTGRIGQSPTGFRVGTRGLFVCPDGDDETNWFMICTFHTEGADSQES